MNKPLRLCLLALVFCCSFELASAQVNALLKVDALAKSDAWSSLIENPLVKVNYKFIYCHDTENGIHQEKVILQFINLSTKQVKIEWQNQLWYDGKCYGCERFEEAEFTKSITVEPLQTTEGICNLTKQSDLVIHSRMLDIPKSARLTQLNINNLKVSLLN